MAAPTTQMALHGIFSQIMATDLRPPFRKHSLAIPLLQQASPPSLATLSILPPHSPLTLLLTATGWPSHLNSAQTRTISTPFNTSISSSNSSNNNRQTLTGTPTATLILTACLAWACPV